MAAKMVRASHVTHRARAVLPDCLLPPSCSADSDVGNFYDISHCHDDDDGLDGAAGLPA